MSVLSIYLKATERKEKTHREKSGVCCFIPQMPMTAATARLGHIAKSQALCFSLRGGRNPGMWESFTASQAH